MNLPPEGVVGVVGAEDEEEGATAAALWAGGCTGGAGLDIGLTMAAAPSVDPMVLGPIFTSAQNHFEATKICKMSLLMIPLMVLSFQRHIFRRGNMSSSMWNSKLDWATICCDDVCDVCSKGFSTSSSLNTHRRIHSGEKPHQCGVCGKRFTASSNLYYHKMTHVKVRKLLDYEEACCLP